MFNFDKVITFNFIITYFINYLFLVKKDTLSDMVDNMADDVAIVHQVPFTCDRIDNSSEPSPPSDESTDPSLFLQLDRKGQNHNQARQQQRRFVATLEKVHTYLVLNYISSIYCKH